MRTEQFAQIFYLSKVVIGLLSVVGVCSAAFLLPKTNFSSGMIWGAFSMFILFFLALIPIVYWFYGKMDELQKRLHEHASVLTTTLLVSISGVLGVLQANQIIPLFNQFWTLAFTIVIWATALSFIDKFYK